MWEIAIEILQIERKDPASADRESMKILFDRLSGI